MSAPGGGAAKADAAISRQPLMNRFLITMPAFPSGFATRRLAVLRPELWSLAHHVAGGLPQTEIATVETGPRAAGSSAKGRLRSLVQILNRSKVSRPMPEGALCFGRFHLDLARRQLLLGLQLGDRASQVLCVLAGAKGALVSKDELMARVWAEQVVEENNLQVQISALRKVLDPEGQAKVGS